MEKHSVSICREPDPAWKRHRGRLPEPPTCLPFYFSKNTLVEKLTPKFPNFLKFDANEFVYTVIRSSVCSVCLHYSDCLHTGGVDLSRLSTTQPMSNSTTTVLYGDLTITRVTPDDDPLLLGCVAITTNIIIEDINITLTVSCELYCNFEF